MKYLYITLFLLFSMKSYGQVGLGTATPHASSAFDIASSNKGVLIPRMSATQRLAISNPVEGLLVFQTGSNSNFYYFDGVQWRIFDSPDTWNLGGNTNTDSDINFLGTIDNQSFVLGTNDIKALELTVDGKLKIGKNLPDAVLHVEDDPLVLIEDGFEDNTLAPFTSNGDLNWQISSNPADRTSGNLGVRSDPALGNNQISELEIVKAAARLSIIKFKARVSTELNFDRFIFLIDGEPMLDLTGVIPFTQYSFAVAAGNHTFTWRYLKDISIDANDDLIAVDDIKFVESNSVLKIEDGTEQDGYVLTSDNQGNTRWSDPTLTEAPDQDWLFISGDQNTDPIYRIGAVKVGDARAPRYPLDVHLGRLEGSQMGIGSTEFVVDGLSEFQFSNSIVPEIDNSLTLGRSGRRWSEIFTVSGVITTSDERLKTNIQPVLNNSSILSKIETASYYWKNEQYGNVKLKGDQRTRNIGFLAHNLSEVLPQSVATTEWVKKEGKTIYEKQNVAHLGVYYQQLIPVIVGSIKEDQTLISQIKEDQKEMERLLNLLKN